MCFLIKHVHIFGTLLIDTSSENNHFGTWGWIQCRGWLKRRRELVPVLTFIDTNPHCYVNIRCERSRSCCCCKNVIEYQ